MTASTEQESTHLGACWECGYSLRGLDSRRCPECGRPFDPADPTTMNMGRNVGPVSKWLMRPPGAPTLTLTAAAVLASLWACAVPTRRGAFVDLLSNSMPFIRGRWSLAWLRRSWLNLDAPEGRFLLAASLWAIVIAIWVVRRAARGAVVKSLSKHRAAPFAYWRRWLIPPVLFGVTVWACTTRLPTYAAFWLSKPWLDNAVREAKSAAPAGVAARARGLYRAHPIGGVQVQTSTARGETYLALAPFVGFVHRDDGNPPAPRTPPRWRVRRMSAHWFLLETGRLAEE